MPTDLPPDDSTRQAYADFHAAVGRAHIALAQALGGEEETHQLGSAQARFVEWLAEHDKPNGYTTNEIAGALNYDYPNAYVVLGTLEKRGLVVRVRDSRPRRWRMP
jgi:DNA-binding MarR family transcriptional regulator